MLHSVLPKGLLWLRSLLGTLLVAAAIFLLWDIWGSTTVFSESKGQPTSIPAPLTPPTTPDADDQLKPLEARTAHAEEQLDVAEKRLDALRARAADI